MRYSVILGNLGNTRDRFLGGGYKEQVTLDETFAQAGSISQVEGVELVGTWDIRADNVQAVKQLLDEHQVRLVSIIPDHFSQKKWGRGAFTSRDPGIRREAVDHTKEMIDVLVELGGELINIWPGQDGYDYILQGNYDRAYDWFVSGVAECAGHNSEVKIALEYKPKEPRNFSYLARWADTLVLAQDTECRNVGVTIDVGHSWVGGENPAEAIYRLARTGRLFHMHFNDNHTAWDDDMIVGSVHTVHYIEMLYWLRKTGYEGWCSMDQYPYREDARSALAESIEWLHALERRLEQYGMGEMEKLIEAGDATATSRELRKLLLG
jgi:xylose isomerase